MNKRIRNLLCVSIVAFLTASCSETYLLRQDLSKYEVTIGYLHDSKKINYTASDSLVVNINNNPIDSLLRVRMVKRTVLPFVIFNSLDYYMNVELGQNIIERPYTDFFTESFIEESKRTGRFGVTNRATNDSVYTLDISIDTCLTSSFFERNTSLLFLFFYYSVSYFEQGSPAETALHVTTTLKKGNTVIAQKEYALSHTQPFLTTYDEGVENLRSNFVSNMVESLTLCTKQCIELMITDINNSLNQ